MEPFRDRLRKAAAHAGVDYSQTAIAKSLGVMKQTVDRWMGDGEPRPAMVFHIGDKWHVDPRWLATGEGSMTQPPSGSGLTAEELEIIKSYRRSEPRSRVSLRAIVKTLSKPFGVAALTIGLTTGFNNKLIAAPSLVHNATVITIAKSLVRAFLRSLLRYKALRFSACRGFATTT